MAFLDDIYTVSPPDRVGTVHRLARALWSEAGIRVHQGKTQIWNSAGEMPDGCEALQTAVVWRGSEELPTHRRGMKVFGTPLGHTDFVRAHLEKTTRDHQVFIDRIPHLKDAWLLVVHCAAARANYQVRAVVPRTVEDFCRTHDEQLWQCLCSILQISLDQPLDVWQTASLPLALGGLGLRSASRVSQPAYWASGADSLVVIGQKHPTVASKLVGDLEGMPSTPFLNAAVEARWDLSRQVAAGARPPFHDPENFEPGTVRGGWQQEASSCVGKHFQVELLDRVPEQVQALIRSQAGPGAGVALSVVPTNLETTILPICFVWFSCAVSASLSLCPCATADVAVYSTPWAIIASLRTGGDARSSGLCCGERCGTYLSGSRRTGSHQHVSERRICRCRWETQGDSKSSWTVYLHAVGRSWQSTPHWCVLCTRTGGPEEEQHSRMGWRLKLPSEGRSPRIRSWWAPTAGQNWWCWPWKSADDGRNRLGLS